MTSCTSPNPTRKPKLVFVQACQVQDLDEGPMSMSEKDDENTPVKIVPVLTRYQTMKPENVHCTTELGGCLQLPTH